MSSLADELLERTDEIVDRWYEAWRGSEHPHAEIDEAAIKDLLPVQLRVIGDPLRRQATAEGPKPKALWGVSGRLDPEERIAQEIPIEEVVQEYGMVVDVVRDWIEERGIEVPFVEYSYFYQAIFELVAESVRRYASYQAHLVTRDRARYLAGVMHQLRTPLATLSMQIEILEKRGRAPEPAAIARLRRSVCRMRLLVDGVLRLERFGPGETPVRPETVQPAKVVEEILNDFRPQAARKGLRIETRVDPALEMTIDPQLLTHSVGNLVHNAVEYTERGFVVLEADEEADAVVFRVRDSGPGLTEEMKASLFREPQSASAAGSGIGLLIARHAAEAQGGEIGFGEEPGGGSVFWVRLPRAVAPRSGSSLEEVRPD